jgi:hypothetical protein
MVVLFSVGMLGCSRAVERNEVIGTWIVTNDSRQRFLSTAQQKASAKILLDANGSFVASEIPENLLYGPPEVADRLVTGSGDWKLTSREGKQQVQLSFNVIATGQRGQVPYGTQLNVLKHGSAVSLFYFQGDPDQGRKIELAKK